MTRTHAAPLVLLAALALTACRGGDRPPDAAALAQDVVMPEPRVVLGRTVPGGYVNGSLKVRAERDALITRAEGTCGCTIVSATLPLRLKAGEVTDIPVALDLSRLAHGGATPEGPRSIEREVVVTSERGARITGVVVADLSDRVRIEPAQVRFGAVAPGSSSTSEVLVSAVPGAPAPEVLSATPDVPDVSVAVDPKTPEGTRLHVTWHPSGKSELAGNLALRLADPREPELRVKLEGRAEALVTVDPDRIERLSAPVSRPVVVSFKVQRRDGLPLAILGAECTSHRVEVTVVGGEGAMRTVRVLVPVLPLPAEINATLNIRTDAAGSESVAVPIRVRAAS